MVETVAADLLGQGELVGVAFEHLGSFTYAGKPELFGGRLDVQLWDLLELDAGTTQSTADRAVTRRPPAAPITDPRSHANELCGGFTPYSGHPRNNGCRRSLPSVFTHSPLCCHGDRCGSGLGTGSAESASGFGNPPGCAAPFG